MKTETKLGEGATAGPWKLVYNYDPESGRDDALSPYIVDIEGNNIAAVMVTHDLWENHLRLIASAPDLLAERDHLRKVNAGLVTLLEDHRIDPPYDGSSERDIEEWFSDFELWRQIVLAALAEKEPKP